MKPTGTDAKGFKDKYGNTWVRGPAHGIPRVNGIAISTQPLPYEFDVQIPSNKKEFRALLKPGKKYINVSIFGTIR